MVQNNNDRDNDDGSNEYLCAHILESPSRIAENERNNYSAAHPYTTLVCSEHANLMSHCSENDQ